MTVQSCETVAEIPGQSSVVCEEVWTAEAVSRREQQPLLIISSPSGHPRVIPPDRGLSTLELYRLALGNS